MDTTNDQEYKSILFYDLSLRQLYESPEGILTKTFLEAFSGNRQRGRPNTEEVDQGC